jgi:hypothetical protein
MRIYSHPRGQRPLTFEQGVTQGNWYEVTHTYIERSRYVERTIRHVFRTVYQAAYEAHHNRRWAGYVARSAIWEMLMAFSSYGVRATFHAYDEEWVKT